LKNKFVLGIDPYLVRIRENLNHKENSVHNQYCQIVAILLL